MKQFIATLMLVLFCAAAPAAEEGFVSLMSAKPGDAWTENGKSLGGFVKYGGEATFRQEGREIVGTRGEGANTFLCTEKKYGNFILRFETKFDIDCNSGMQFRSDVRPEKNRQRVFGYQCEIEPAGKATGVIYDEGRRGRWLEPIRPEQVEAIEKAYKKGEWNEVAIQCVGPSIKIRLNGVPITDVYDIESSEGFFGMQVHSGKQGRVRWRNLRIKELPATPWIPLFVGGKYGDVEQKPVGEWVVQEDGSVRGTTPTGEKRDGLLISKKMYKNFAVKASWKTVAGNSGLYFRAVPIDKPHWLRGFQCEIAANGNAAGLWDVPPGRGWVARNEELGKKVYKPEAWNTNGVVAIGDHLITYLNGEKMVDIVDPECLKEGYTALQLHGGGDQAFLFRDYWIMPLDEAAVALINAE